MTYRTISDCPACKQGSLTTKDSRPSLDLTVVRRRRKVCDTCGYKCSTHEIIVADEAGFANSHIRKVREFLNGVDALAKDVFADETGAIRKPQGSRKKT